MLVKILRAASFLNLDVVVAALACLCYADFVCGEVLHIWYYLVLALSVWLIYTSDHLMDARHSVLGSMPQRYQFHARYGVILMTLVLLAAISAFFIALFALPWPVWQMGTIVAFLCGLHLLLAQKAHAYPYHKELFVALLFSCGVWLGPLVKIIDADLFNTRVLLAILQLFSAAWSNLLILALFERHQDQRNKSDSQVLKLGLFRSKWLLYVLYIVSNLSALIVAFKYQSYGIALVMLFTGNWPLAMFRYYKYFKRNNLYRWIANIYLWSYALPCLGRLLLQAQLNI